MKLTPEKITAFCAALAETCNVGKACAAVGISRQTAYGWRDDDPDFAERWERALRIGVSALEDEAHRRAFEGIPDPLTHQGQFTYLTEPVLDEDGKPIRNDDGSVELRWALDANGNRKVASVQKYSDTLAIFLLKAHNPEKYRDNSKVELAGQLALTDMTEEEMKAELATLVASGVALDGPDDGCDLV